MTFSKKLTKFNYLKKYLKYKNKYLNLKYQTGCSASNNSLISKSAVFESSSEVAGGGSIKLITDAVSYVFEEIGEKLK